MQAIVVKYRGPTNTRGSRLIASAVGGRITVSYDYAERDGGKRAAAVALADKLGWKNADKLIEGGLPNGDTVFVFPEY